MFKLVVLCAFLAAAAAKPDLLVAAPLTQYSTFVSPGSTTITKSASSVIHPSPLVYSAPLAYTHFIKKRSPQLSLSYIAPTSYLTSSLGATAYSTPLLHSSSIYPAIAPTTYTTAHLIKKRSPQLLTSSFITPTTYTSGAPIFTSYSAASPLISSAPWISHPVSVAHLIKKRSAPLLTTYLAPSSVSHQSRIDLHSTPFVTSYSTPIAYSSPLAYSHII